MAWVESLPGKDGAPSPYTAIYVKELQSAAMPRRITAGNGVAAFAEHGLAWSPDSRRLAFLSDKDAPGQLQLYIAELPGGAAQRQTRLAGFLDEPRWSPDGKLLAFLFTENSTRASGPLQPAALDAGVVEEHIFEQRLAILNPATGVVRQISPADLYVYEYDWSPDASRFVAIAAHGSG
ncbi:MAG TPA: hypothetical protein VE775_11165, partial [Pyrinomonadaceae bacterium]|nr:hypothetical protein [Pyrinomonadaceae bacterium]